MTIFCIAERPEADSVHPEPGPRNSGAPDRVAIAVDIGPEPPTESPDAEPSTESPEAESPDAEPRSSRQNSPEDPLRTAPSRLGPYNLRIPKTSDGQPCRHCGKWVRCDGVTGFLADHVVCDGCLLSADRPLGMALMMLALCRYYGAAEPADALEERRARQELMAFARIYERNAAELGPPRPWSDFFSNKPGVFNSQDGTQGP